MRELLASYRFKLAEEAAWIGIVAAATGVLEALVRFDPSTVTDWRTYAIGLGAGCVRAAAGAIIAWRTDPLRRQGTAG